MRCTGLAGRAGVVALDTSVFPRGSREPGRVWEQGRQQVFTYEPPCAWQSLGSSHFGPFPNLRPTIYLIFILSRHFVFILNTFILKKELRIFTIVASSCLSNRYTK